MKKIACISLLLAILMLSNNIRMGLYAGYYLINKEGFIQIFCQNKDKPELHCDGKCKLSEISAESTKNEVDKTFKELHQDFNWIVQFVPLYHFVMEGEIRSHSFHYLYSFWEKIPRTIFHPPTINVYLFDM